jgi:hypothetical protein
MEMQTVPHTLFKLNGNFLCNDEITGEELQQIRSAPTPGELSNFWGGMWDSLSDSNKESAKVALWELTHIKYGSSTTEILTFIRLRSLASDDSKQNFSWRVDKTKVDAAFLGNDDPKNYYYNYNAVFCIAGAQLFNIRGKAYCYSGNEGPVQIANNPVSLLFCEEGGSLCKYGTRDYFPHNSDGHAIGGRGDMALWNELALSFVGTEMSKNRKSMEQLLVEKINSFLKPHSESWDKSTDSTTTSLERVNGGGGGMGCDLYISVKLWKETLIPLLLARFDKQVGQH